MFRKKALFKILVALLTFTMSSVARAQDPGWPRQVVKPGGTLTAHQPQSNDWNNFTNNYFGGGGRGWGGGG